MGCKEMKPRHTIWKNVQVSVSVLILLFLAIFALSSLCFQVTMIIPAQGGAYVPAPPTGPNNGFVSIDYRYEIITMNDNASWMFDWGDGTTTPWLQLGRSNTSIVQTHHWTAAGDFTVRIKFKNINYLTGIWSDPLLVSITRPQITDYPSEPTLVAGTIKGVMGTTYTYSLKANDPHAYRVQYRCDWGNGTISNSTSLVPSGSPATRNHQWDKPCTYMVRFQTLNEYGLQSVWSSSIHVTIQNTTDSNQTFVDLIVLNGITHNMTYHADHTGTFYNTTTGKSSSIYWEGQGTYSLDDDNDGTWDYEYTPSVGLLEPIPPQVVVQKPQALFGIPWLWVFIIIGIIVGVIVTVVVLFKTGYLYMYEEVVEK